MKTVSGKLVSVKPISLSKASRYISDFASFENNGVSDTISIYLNRASQAFSSLVQFHKDIKNPHSSHKKHKQKSINGQEYANAETKKKRKEKEGVEVEASVGSELRKGGENDGNVEDGNTVNGFVEQKSKKKTKKEEEGEENVNIREDLKVELEHKKKKRKKREEIGIKDMLKKVKLEETESKEKIKKRGEIDGELKENSVDPIKKKRKKSKVSNDD